MGERSESDVGVASSHGEHMRSGGVLQSGIFSRSNSFPGIAVQPPPRVFQSKGGQGDIEPGRATGSAALESPARGRASDTRGIVAHDSSKRCVRLWILRDLGATEGTGHGGRREGSMRLVGGRQERCDQHSRIARRSPAFG